MEQKNGFTYEVKQYKTHEEWQPARLGGVGTSELDQACDHSPFGTPTELWRRKVGLDKPLEQNEDMKRGHELEPAVRNRFMRDYGTYFELDYHEFWMYYRSDYGMIFATLDGILKAKIDCVVQFPGCKPMSFCAGERAILEIKNPRPRLSFKYKDWDNLPDHYLYQNAGQMFCTGIEKHIEIANLTGEYAHPDEDGMDLRFWVSQYSDYLPLIEEIKATIPKFWESVVEKRQVPTALDIPEEPVVMTFKVEAGEINENFDAVKESIQKYANGFKGLKFTEDQYSQAKDFRTELNSQIKLIEDARKSVKKQYLEPLEKFEDKCKQLTAIINEVKTPIEKQLTEFDEREKKEKKTSCLALIEEALATLPENYQDIISKSGGIAFNEKWLNKTVKISAVKKDIQAIMDAEKSNLDLFFNAVMLPAAEVDADAIMNAFLTSGRNVNAALETKNRIESMRAERERREAERKAQEALRQAQMEAQLQQMQEEMAKAPEPQPEPAPEPVYEEPAPVVEPPKMYSITLEIITTNKAQFADLSAFLKNNGFTFKRLK